VAQRTARVPSKCQDYFGGKHMNDELVSLRILLFSAKAAERDLLRRGALATSVPVEVVEVETVAAARAKIAAGDIDLIFADAALADADRAALMTQAQAVQHKPFVFLLAANPDEAQSLSGGGADGVVVKPAKQDDAKLLVERCARVRLPSRVLVVDDSLTMRGIVRKILAQSRFRLDITEAQEGVEAIKQIATGKFDIAFLDYNMPGLNGIETLAGIKRQSPDLHVIMMTSQADEVLAERARRAGAAAFLKKPFYPADIDMILNRIFGLQAPPG
jgi:CheY-like chemotaxis protein